MKYKIRSFHGQGPESQAGEFSSASLADWLVHLRDGNRLLIIEKSVGNYIEVAFSKRGFAVSESYEGKLHHLRKPIDEQSLKKLLCSYEKGSLADSIDWYPTLVEWRGLRFGHPPLFRALNERYRVSSPLAITFFLSIGVLLFLLSFAIAVAFDIPGKAVLLPLGIYAVICAKRIDFVDRSRRAYGYRS